MPPPDSPSVRKPLGVPRSSSVRQSMSITRSVGKALADVINNQSTNVSTKTKESRRLSLTTLTKKGPSSVDKAAIATTTLLNTVNEKSPMKQASTIPTPPSTSPTSTRRGASTLKPKPPVPSSSLNAAPLASSLPKYRPKSTIFSAKPPTFSPARRKRRGSSEDDLDQNSSAVDIPLAARPLSPLPRRSTARLSILSSALLPKNLPQPVSSSSQTARPRESLDSQRPPSISPTKHSELKKRRTTAVNASSSSSVRSSPRSTVTKPQATVRPPSSSSMILRPRTISSVSTNTTSAARKLVPAISALQESPRSSPRIINTPDTPPQTTKQPTSRLSSTPSKKAGSSLLTPNRIPAATKKSSAPSSPRRPVDASRRYNDPEQENVADISTDIDSIDAGDVSALLGIDNVLSPVKPGAFSPVSLRKSKSKSRLRSSDRNPGGSPQTPSRSLLPPRAALSYFSPPRQQSQAQGHTSPPLTPPLNASLRPPSFGERNGAERGSILSWEQLASFRAASGMEGELDTMLADMDAPFNSTPLGLGSPPGLAPGGTGERTAHRERVDSGWGPESPTPFEYLRHSSPPPLPPLSEYSNRGTSGRSSAIAVSDESRSIGQVLFPTAEPHPQRRTPPRSVSPAAKQEDTAGALVTLLRLQLASAEERANRVEKQNEELASELEHWIRAVGEEKVRVNEEKEIALAEMREAIEEDKMLAERKVNDLVLEVKKQAEEMEEIQEKLMVAEQLLEEKEAEHQFQIEQDSERRSNSIELQEHNRIVTQMRSNHHLDKAIFEADESYRLARMAVEQELELVKMWKEVTSALGGCLQGDSVANHQFPICV